VRSPCASVGTEVSTFAEEISQHEEAAKSRHISALERSRTAMQTTENAATDSKKVFF